MSCFATFYSSTWLQVKQNKSEAQDLCCIEHTTGLSIVKSPLIAYGEQAR